VVLPCRALAQLVVAAPQGSGPSSAAELCARALKTSEDAPGLDGPTFMVVLLCIVLFVVVAAGVWYCCLPKGAATPRRMNSSRITYAKTGPGTLIVNIVQAKGISAEGGMTVQVRAGDIYGGKETRVVHGESPLWNEEKHLPVLEVSEVPKCTFELRAVQGQRTVGTASMDITHMPVDTVLDKEIPVMQDGSQIGVLQFAICFETIHGGRRIPSSSALVSETRHSARAPSPSASVRTNIGGGTFGSARSVRTQPQTREIREMRRGSTDRTMQGASFPEPP